MLIRQTNENAKCLGGGGCDSQPKDSEERTRLERWESGFIGFYVMIDSIEVMGVGKPHRQNHTQNEDIKITLVQKVLELNEKNP